MKIAICYSGMFRNFQKHVDNHIEHLISKYDCDVYLSFWDVYGFGTCLIKSAIKDNDFISEQVKQEVLNKLQPKNFEFESYSELDKFFESEGIKYDEGSDIAPYCKNVLSMYYKIHKCGEMVKNSGIDYDIIIRLRSDIFFYEDLILQSPKENTVYHPAIYSWGSAMNDQLVYGNKEVMYVYHDLYNKLHDIWEQGTSRGAPEHFLTNYIIRNNISMVSYGLNYRLKNINDEIK